VCGFVVVRGAECERGGRWSATAAPLVCALLAAGCGRAASPAEACVTAHVSAGSVGLARCPVPEVTLVRPCGEGCRQVTRLGSVSLDASLSCATGRAFWWVADGHLYRAEIADGRTTSVLGPFRTELPVAPTGLACDGDDVVFTATVREREQERLDLVARLRDGDARARVLWSDRALRQTQASPTRPAVSGSTVAWLWEFTVPALFVLRGGSGAASTVRADLRMETAPAAAGDGLYFQSGARIERWFPGMSTPEVLSRAEGDQWSPVAWGRRVAWVDQRDEPRGSFGAPRNPQVYVLDTSTGARLGAASLRRPAWRGDPSLSEGWVVWVDTRNDPVPDREPGAWQRAEVWGRPLPDGAERALTPNAVAALPRVVGGNLLYVSTSDGIRRDLFAQPMPRD